MIAFWCMTAVGAVGVVGVGGDPCADAAAWAARCAEVPGLTVRTRLVEPLTGREGRNGTIEVSRTVSWGWPPRLRVDQSLQARPERMPAVSGGAPVANPPRLSVFWATGAGEVIDVERAYSGRGGSFTRSSFGPTREAALVDAWTESPLLLGRMVHAETGGELGRFTLTEEGVRVVVSGVPVVMRLVGSERLVSLRFSRPGGGSVAAEYTGFSPGPGGVMVPGEVRWSLSDAWRPGASVEAGDRVRTVELKASPGEPSAEVFVPDLVGLTSTDPRSGEVRDASGTLLVVVPRAGSWSWAWLALTGGMGLAVAAVGGWVWRGRVA